MTQTAYPRNMEEILNNLETSIDYKVKLRRDWLNLPFSGHIIETGEKVDPAIILNTVAELLAFQVKHRLYVLDKLYESNPSLLTQERKRKMNSYFRYRILFGMDPDESYSSLIKNLR